MHVLALLFSLSAPACAFVGTPPFGACRRPGGVCATVGRGGLPAFPASPCLGKLPPLGAVSMLLLADDDGSRRERGPGGVSCGRVRRRCSLPALDAAQGRDEGLMSQDYVSEEAVGGWSRGGRMGSLSENSIQKGERQASDRRESGRSGRDTRDGMRGVGGSAGRSGGGRGGYRSAPGASDARRLGQGIRGSDETTASVKEVPPFSVQTTPPRTIHRFQWLCTRVAAMRPR